MSDRAKARGNVRSMVAPVRKTASTASIRGHCPQKESPPILPIYRRTPVVYSTVVPPLVLFCICTTALLCSILLHKHDSMGGYLLGIFRTFDSPILLLPMALSYLILLFGPCVIKLKKANVPKCNTRVYSIQIL